MEWKFFALDVLTYMLIFGIFFSMHFFVPDKVLGDDELKAAVIWLPPALVDVPISLVFAITAYYLAKSAKKSTGKKQNSCLLIWHLTNLFFLTMIAILSSSSYFLYFKHFNAWE